jgi:aryl carrier-like protein
MYHNVPKDAVGGSSALNSNSLKPFLSRAADDPDILGEGSSTDFLAQEIGVRIFRFTMKPEEDIELGMTLSQIGMDSLMAIELKRWWKQAFGLHISVLEIMGSGTLEELGKVAAQNLKKCAVGS